MFSLTGKTIVITGGGRGIGRGIARACAMAGAAVAITGRSADVLEDTRAELEELGAQCLFIAGDIMSHDGIAEIVTRTTARFGTIDGWVNNAGSASVGDVGPLIELDEGQWDRVVDLNEVSATADDQASLWIESGLEPGAFGVDPAEYYLN